MSQRAGPGKNLDFLVDLVKQRISPASQKEVLDLIETAAGKLIWELHTPTVLELEQLAIDLNSIATQINEWIAHLWDMDENSDAGAQSEDFDALRRSRFDPQ